MLCCESLIEERSAGNPHATFCGNRRRVTAFGDPVGRLVAFSTPIAGLITPHRHCPHRAETSGSWKTTRRQSRLLTARHEHKPGYSGKM